MRLNDLLRSDNISLVGRSYAALKEIEFSKFILQEMRQKQLEAVAVLVCKSSTRIIGIAFKDKFWTLVTDVVNMDPEFDRHALDFFERVQSSKKMTFYLTRSELHDAVLFILSSALLSGNNCECATRQRSYALAYSLERQERIRLLFKTKLELTCDLSKFKILEICCGNGMGTAVLRALGYNVFALDNDKCSICEGLYHGALEMDKAVVLDASTVSRYEFFNSQNFSCVIGLMLGSIYEFNKCSWQEILAETVSIVSRGVFIFTVHRKEEVDFVFEAMTNLGLKGEILDNRDSLGIYDQWVYIGKKE
jgi:SAM-dependent methyltransferase